MIPTEDLKKVLSIADEAMIENPDGTIRLVATECRDCGQRVFPPTEVCPECMSESIKFFELSEKGTLYSWSVVHAAPKNWITPYIAGYVDMPEGVRVFAHIVNVDPEILSFDMPVSVCKVTMGLDPDGKSIESYSFVPSMTGGN